MANQDSDSEAARSGREEKDRIPSDFIIAALHRLMCVRPPKPTCYCPGMTGRRGHPSEGTSAGDLLVPQSPL
jgi:hypothetical protein